MHSVVKKIEKKTWLLVFVCIGTMVTVVCASEEVQIMLFQVQMDDMKDEMLYVCVVHTRLHTG